MRFFFYHLNPSSPALSWQLIYGADISQMAGLLRVNHVRLLTSMRASNFLRMSANYPPCNPLLCNLASVAQCQFSCPTRDRDR
ncbi:hypothetical protein COMA2_10097 [Candidatus Nitrospira nitrificans]|uniref:Uncharacterized protein n=1 Tax=Candidatus Nitrospira nitrificans TaxID=1742973 RepID=A0A0S4L1T5_9BACT|nr:hypothetical protein COMA2_10097 [Candidatus Nitrospira nitrificans]